MKRTRLLIVGKSFSGRGTLRVPVIAPLSSVARKTGNGSDEIGLRRYRGNCEFVIVFLSREVSSSIEGIILFWVWMDGHVEGDRHSFLDIPVTFRPERLERTWKPGWLDGASLAVRLFL